MVSQIYFVEINLEDDKGDKDAKGITYQAEWHVEEMWSLCDEDEDLVGSLALLSKNINKMIKRLNKKWSNVKNKRIQCSECEGFRHIWAKSANRLKSKKNSLNSTNSDGDFDYNCSLENTREM